MTTARLQQKGNALRVVIEYELSTPDEVKATLFFRGVLKVLARFEHELTETDPVTLVGKLSQELIGEISAENKPSQT